MKKYELLKILGQGSYGKVFKALNRQTKEVVALKVVKNTEEAKNEVEILEKFTPCHPNISCYYKHFINKDNLFIEMEYIQGDNLYVFAKRYRTNEHPISKHLLYQYLLLIIKYINNALIYIHDKGILHNDIKPENIIIDKMLVPKLIDFGFACEATFCEIKGEKCCKNVSSGTPDFASPEMYMYGITYPVSDIWSLGVSIYDAAVGNYPFNYPSRVNLKDIVDTILYTEPVKLNTSNQLLNDIVNLSLIKDPMKRINSFQINDLVEDLS